MAPERNHVDVIPEFLLLRELFYELTLRMRNAAEERVFQKTSPAVGAKPLHDGRQDSDVACQIRQAVEHEVALGEPVGLRHAGQNFVNDGLHRQGAQGGGAVALVPEPCDEFLGVNPEIVSRGVFQPLLRDRHYQSERGQRGVL